MEICNVYKVSPRPTIGCNCMVLVLIWGIAGTIRRERAPTTVTGNRGCDFVYKKREWVLAEEHGDDLGSVGGIVGHSDTRCQSENVGETDIHLFFSDEAESLGLRRPQHLQRELPVTIVEAAPEVQKGQFVGIIDDLTRAWRLRRSVSTVQQIVRRDMEIGGDSR